jgi:hypothetical protein
LSEAAEASRRLIRLADILNTTEMFPVPSTSISPRLPFQRIRLERIRKLTAELRPRSGCQPDDIDHIVTRLLLDEYAEAVAQLQAIAHAAAERLHEVPPALTEVGRYVHSRAQIEKRARR